MGCDCSCYAHNVSKQDRIGYELWFNEDTECIWRWLVCGPRKEIYLFVSIFLKIKVGLLFLRKIYCQFWSLFSLCILPSIIFFLFDPSMLCWLWFGLDSLFWSTCYVIISILKNNLVIGLLLDLMKNNSILLFKKNKERIQIETVKK
jgi:hypothetical protein